MKTAAYNDVLNRAAELAGRTRDKIPPSEALMLQGFFAVDLEDVWNSQCWPDLIPDFYQANPNGRAISKQQGAAPIVVSGSAATDGSATVTFTSSTPHGLVVGDTATISGAMAGQAYFNGTFPVATLIDASNFTYLITPQNSASGAAGLTCSGQKAEIGDVLGIFTANPRVTTRVRPVVFTEGNNTIWLDENLATVWIEFMTPPLELMDLSSTQLAGTLIPALFSNYLALRGAGHLLRSDSQFASGDEMLALAETALAAQTRRLGPPPAWRQVRLRGDYGRLPSGTNI